MGRNSFCFGDFNVPLHHLIDTSAATSHLPYWALRQIRLSLQYLSLHDTWRTLHPHDKDYTYFSAPHNNNKYSRLNYLVLSQPNLPYLYKTTIKPMLNSDHHSISLCLTFPKHIHTSKIWRLDSNLLTDKERIIKLRTTITNYFQDNDTPDTLSLTQWEAHKCVIQGASYLLPPPWTRKNRNLSVTSLPKCKH